MLKSIVIVGIRTKKAIVGLLWFSGYSIALFGAGYGYRVYQSEISPAIKKAEQAQQVITTLGGLISDK